MLIPCLEGKPDNTPSRAERGDLGLDAARGVELHAGAAVPRPRVGVDDTAPSRGG